MTLHVAISSLRLMLRGWCWMTIQPLAGLRRGLSIGAGGPRIYQGRWFREPEARDQSPPVDWLTGSELLKEASWNPGARHHSAVSTAITSHRWDWDQRPKTRDQRPQHFLFTFYVWLTNGDSCEVVAGFQERKKKLITSFQKITNETHFYSFRNQTRHSACDLHYTTTGWRRLMPGSHLIHSSFNALERFTQGYRGAKHLN